MKEPCKQDSDLEEDIESAKILLEEYDYVVVSRKELEDFYYKIRAFQDEINSEFESFFIGEKDK